MAPRRRVADIENVTRDRRHALGLALLTGLFAVRVAAQPLSALADVPFLPGFDAWHSGALPYPLLVLSQLVILGAMVAVTRAMWRGTLITRPRLGPWLLGAAAAYAIVMTARLTLGATTLRGDAWFDRPLPSAFHLVLAAYLGCCGRWHTRDA